MPLDLLRTRLTAQHLAAPLSSPADVVRALGAVQAQDYRGALWGIGLRTKGATEADVVRAIDDASIVRTWPMRGTLHFVAAEDARWMVRTLAPRVITRTAGRRRQLGLDAPLLRKAGRVLEKALDGRRTLTRPETFALLRRARIATDGQRGIHIVGHLAMEGVLCIGPHRGAQPTFALLDEWARAPRSLEGDAALAELATRYFEGHGPATERDFAWWTGLPLGLAHRGIAAAARAIIACVARLPPGAEHPIEGRAHWTAPSPKAARDPGLLLLPAYDEYTVGYRDRSAFLDPAHAVRTTNGIMTPVVVSRGRIVGTWSRRLAKGRVSVAAEPFEPVAPQSLDAAVRRYARFLDLPLE